MKVRKKGQVDPLIGAFIGLMVVVIVGVAVVIPVIQDQITLTSATSDAAETGVNATNNTILTLADGDLISGSFLAVNSTNGETILSANYTVTLGTQSTAGTVSWLFVGTNSSGPYSDDATANVTYRVYESTYLDNRTVVGLLELIPLFLVLAILIAALLLIRF